MITDDEPNVYLVRECKNADELVRWSKSKNPFVRAAVAGNRNTPLVTREFYLASDEHPGVRASVAANELTSDEAHFTLSKDPSWAVRVCQAGNPGTPPEILSAFVPHRFDKKPPPECFVVVNHPRLPPDALERLTHTPNDKDWKKIRAVARKRLGFKDEDQNENGSTSC